MKTSELKQIIREEIKHSLNEDRKIMDRKQLISTLTKLLKGGYNTTPMYGDAADLCHSMSALYDDTNQFFKKGHPDIHRLWNIFNLLAGSGEDGLFEELITIKMSLGMVIKKAIKAIKSVP